MKSYFITDPKYYNSLLEFELFLESIYQKREIDFACFRDKINNNISPFAEIFIKITKKYNIKGLINSNIEIAKKLNFDGVHLTSQQFNKIEEAKKNLLYTIVSTHSLEEVKRVEKLGADAFTYSPIFETPNKGKPKGIENLKKVVKESSINCFALGGIISEREIELCRGTNCYGFASIRYFVEN